MESISLEAIFDLSRRLEARTRFIYVLRDPRTHEVRYVGLTLDVECRFAEHLRSADRFGTPLSRWIWRLQIRGLKPVVEVIDETTTTSGSAALERQWIHRFSGRRLLNRSHNTAFTFRLSKSRHRVHVFLG